MNRFETTEPGQAVVITGMHRSGTSLTASLLQHAGVDVGDDLLGPHESNPHGHFEDLDFVELHSSIFERLDRGLLSAGEIPLADLLPEERRRARELIEAKQHAPVWGWKDPRTCLLLPLYQDLLSEARYVLVHRHPVDVVLSLVRRATDQEIVLAPETGLAAWKRYNAPIVRLVETFPERCFLVDVYSVSQDPEGFVQKVRDRWGLPLNPQGVVHRVHQADLHDDLPRPGLKKLLAAVDPEAARMHARLESLSSMPRPPEPLEPVDRCAEDLARARAIEALTGLMSLVSQSSEAALALFTTLPTLLEPESEVRRKQRLADRFDRLAAHASNLETLVEESRRHVQNLEREMARQSEELRRIRDEGFRETSKRHPPQEPSPPR